MPLAGFVKPQFSPDAKRIYFVSTVWATSSAIQLLDLGTGQVHFICSGLSVEVIPSGHWSGYIIAYKEIHAVLIARKFRYWLLDRDGQEVGEIGDTEKEVAEFKNE